MVGGRFLAGVSYLPFNQSLLTMPITVNCYVFYIVLPIEAKFQSDLIVHNEYLMLRNIDLKSSECFKESKLCS